MSKEEFISKCDFISRSDMRDFDCEIGGLSVNVVNEDHQLNIHVWKNGSDDDLAYFGIDYEKAADAYDIVSELALTGVFL